MCCSPAGSHVHGISQARTLEWVSISLSRGSSRSRDQTHVACTDRRILYHKATGKPFERDFSLYAWVLSHFSHVRLFTTLRTVAHQAPLSMGFSRQEYWSGLPCPPPGDLPDPGINLSLLCLLHWKLGSLPLVQPGKLFLFLNVFN